MAKKRKLRIERQRRRAMALGWTGIPKGKALPRGWI